MAEHNELGKAGENAAVAYLEEYGYLEKYKITNKSRWLRETILMFIHKNMEEDYPTLFGEHDMRR